MAVPCANNGALLLPSQAGMPTGPERDAASLSQQSGFYAEFLPLPGDFCARQGVKLKPIAPRQRAHGGHFARLEFLALAQFGRPRGAGGLLTRRSTDCEGCAVDGDENRSPAHWQYDTTRLQTVRL